MILDYIFFELLFSHLALKQGKVVASYILARLSVYYLHNV